MVGFEELFAWRPPKKRLALGGPLLVTELLIARFEAGNLGMEGKVFLLYLDEFSEDIAGSEILHQLRDLGFAVFRFGCLRDESLVVTLNV